MYDLYSTRCFCDSFLSCIEHRFSLPDHVFVIMYFLRYLPQLERKVELNYKKSVRMWL